MNTHQDDAQPAATRDVKPLPQGYLWRVIVVITLLLSASLCFLFVNSILGSILMLAGLAFGKFSNLNDLEKEVIASTATDNNSESPAKNTQQ